MGGPIRDYGLLLLVLLVVGGVAAAGAVFLLIGRCLKPVKLLTQGARRIAGGEFEHSIAANSHDEIQELAEQFNNMAFSLKDSYAGLEQKVEERTQELRRSEIRYRTLFDDSQDAVVVTSQDGKIIDANRAVLELFGYSREEAAEVDISSEVYVNLDDRRKLIEAVERHGSVRDYEVILRKKDGTLIDCLVTGSVWRDAEGSPMGYQSIVRDITERKRVEAALRDSEARFRQVAQSANDGVVSVDSDGNIVFWNSRAESIFGYGEAEVLGHNFRELLPPAYRDRHYLQVDSDRDSDERLLQGSTVELQAVKKDGAEFPVEMSMATWKMGEETYCTGIIRDITDRKLAEETLVQQMRELAVLEERNRMAREIHDTLAQGFTGIVLQLEAAEQVLDEDHDEVTSHLGTAKGLARESLQEARRTVWGLVPHALQQQSLVAALQERVGQLNSTGNGTASFSTLGTPRALSVDAQVTLLRICQESLTNVSRHSGATEVEVTLSFQADSVGLKVSDNGVGFDRASPTVEDGAGGFGLMGMDQRARQLGASFTIDSRKGRGTVIEVQVPTGPAGN